MLHSDSPNNYFVYSATAATVDITPSRAVSMGSGPSASSVQSGSVPGESLEANIMLLRDSENLYESCLLVSLDLLYPGAEIRSAIEAAASELQKDRIFVAATHTHRAPMTCVSCPSLGEVDAEYLLEIQQKLDAAIRNLISATAGAEAQLRVGKSAANHSINRRLFKRFFLAKRPRFNLFTNAPNPKGPTDETITTAEFRSRSGQPLAILWNYACHPVSHPNAKQYSSHYPGFVRTLLRSQKGEVPILFFQGFSGNTRPDASARVHKPKEIIRRIFSGPLFDDMTWPTYRKWSSSLADEVLQALDTSQVNDGSGIQAQKIITPGTELATSGRNLTFQSIKLGRDFQLVGVSGEPVVEYANIVREFSTTKNTMCIGCIDEPYGYIPTDEIILQGGYESDQSRTHFGVGEYVFGYQRTIEKSFLEVVTIPHENTDET